MATGRSTQLTKQVGEYLVAAELCRRGLISTTFTGNVPVFDLLTINKRLKTVPVQVKTIRAGFWQFSDARKFLKISIVNGIQTIKGKISLSDPNLIFVFVRLKGFGEDKDEFYICRKKNLQDIIYKGHKKWLSEKGGKRPRNPASMHCAVSPDDLKDFKNNWSLFF